MTRQEKIEYIAALRERLIREARTDLLPFTRATMPTFDPAEFHIRYYLFSNFAIIINKSYIIFNRFIKSLHFKKQKGANIVRPYATSKEIPCLNEFLQNS